jgi:hypothetical protein
MTFRWRIRPLELERKVNHVSALSMRCPQGPRPSQGASPRRLRL